MKKVSIGIGAAAASAVLAFALAAAAQTASTSAQSGAAPEAPGQRMVLQVGPAGRVLLRGTIDGAANGVLTVKSWGGDWTVNVPSSARVLPAAAGNDLSKFQTGDFVGLEGTVSQGASWTIDATIVRDWTYRQAVTQEARQNRQAVRETMRSESPRNYQGTAGAVSGSSFPYTSASGASYTVNVAAGAKVLDKRWLPIGITDIQSGDAVRVWGANASGTITAEVVRDLSIPRASR